MKKIKVWRVSRLEEEIEELLPQGSKVKARVLGAVVRDMLGVVQRHEQRDEVRFCVGGTIYKMTLEKEK